MANYLSCNGLRTLERLPLKHILLATASRNSNLFVKFISRIVQLTFMALPAFEYRNLYCTLPKYYQSHVIHGSSTPSVTSLPPLILSKDSRSRIAHPFAPLTSADHAASSQMWAIIQSRRIKRLVILENGPGQAVTSSKADNELAPPGEKHSELIEQATLIASDRHGCKWAHLGENQWRQRSHRSAKLVIALEIQKHCNLVPLDIHSSMGRLC